MTAKTNGLACCGGETAPRQLFSNGARAASRRALGALGLAAVASCASIRTSSVGPAAAAPSASPTATVAHAVSEDPQNDPRTPMDDAERIPVGQSPTLGPSTALVTVVVFSDFQCPFCSRVLPTLEQLRQRFGDDVRVVFKHNPLPFHQNAVPAAMAAIEAFNQQGSNAFWAMHDVLFRNQRALERADLERYAEELQLDVPRFMAAVDSRAHQQVVDADQALARSLELMGTPAFAINGVTFAGARPFADFEAEVTRALQTARRITPRSRAYAAMVANPLPPPEFARRNNPSPSHPPRREDDPDVRYRVPVDNAPAQGPADALVTIVEFSDFQCPFCSRVQPVLAELRRRYPQDVRIVWRNRPLEFHPRAYESASAAMEAYAQRGSTAFFRMHDLLFENQHAEGGLERPAFDRYALSLRLLVPRFRRAIATDVHHEAIARDIALAEQIGANGTPHFFINGRRLVGAQPLERFVAAVERELTDARALVAQGTPRARVYAALTDNGATAPVYRNPGGGAPSQGSTAPLAHPLRDNPRAPSRGPASARVVLQIFTDFQCPFCARVRPTLEQLLARYPNDVRLVFRHYPLAFHPNAMLAAEAASEAYAQQGDAGFWAMHDLLFQNQRALDRADLERYAQQIQLDMPRFRSALDQHTHQSAVRDDMAAADATGAEMGTPAFFVNGRFFAGARPLDEFVRVVDAALAAPRNP